MVVGSDAPAAAVSLNDFKGALRGYKKMLEDLARFNTVGKLVNLKIGPDGLDDLRDWRWAIHCLRMLLEAVNDLRPLTDYLSSAEAYLPASHPWQSQAADLRQRTLETLRRLARSEAEPDAVLALRRELEALKKAYIAAYAEQHRRLALGPNDDACRRKLYDDPRRKALQALRGVDLLGENVAQLRAWDNAISELHVCREFHEGVLDSSPLCPHCKINPAAVHTDLSAEVRLKQLDERLTTLLSQWRQALRAALTSPQAQASMQAMTAAERRPLEDFLAQADGALDLPAGFVESANRALRGIRSVRLSADDLLAALRTGGLPCTVDEFRARFNRFLQQALRGCDESNTRLTLDS